MWRSLFSPKWLLVHIGVAGLVVLMLNLSLWQFHRLDDKKAFNLAVTTRIAQPVRPVFSVLTATELPTNIEWRRVEATGTYDPDEAVTIINRSQNGSAGYDTLVPLTTESGTKILVNRGFVPLAQQAPALPNGKVIVVGYLRASQSRTGLGLKDADSKETTEFQRFDVPRISSQIEGNVAPMFLQLIQDSSSDSEQWPAPVPLPPLDEGSHLSYAVQWIFFSLVALTAWGFVVRKKLRDVATDAAVQAQTSA